MIKNTIFCIILFYIFFHILYIFFYKTTTTTLKTSNFYFAQVAQWPLLSKNLG